MVTALAEQGFPHSSQKTSVPFLITLPDIKKYSLPWTREVKGIIFVRVTTCLLILISPV
jgi:hypothetical protein